MPLYNRLKEYRARLGVTSRKWAGLAGVSRQNHQPDRAGELLPLCDPGAEAGKAVPGLCGGYFQL